MLFSQEEIQLAKRIREIGIRWEPEPGHYVYDETGFCHQPSPFQDRVYYILNYPYFIRAAGGVDRFKEIMIWLPTWADLCAKLRIHGVSDLEVAEYLKRRRAIELGIERVVLYELLELILLDPVSPPAIPID